MTNLGFLLSCCQRLPRRPALSYAVRWSAHLSSLEENNEGARLAGTAGPNKVLAPRVDRNTPTIGRTIAEQELLYIQQPEMPENPKILKISVLGVPNSGKSTLVNRLMNRRVCAVSSKINTTRSRTTAVLTDRDTQVVILDTPGLVSLKKKKKFNLDRQMIIDPHASLWEADLICVVHDVSDEFAGHMIDKELIKCLFAHPEKESILILNKIDKVKNKRRLLDLCLDVTGGCLNGKEFISKDKQDFKKLKAKDTISNYDFERLFEKTAKSMNLKLEAGPTIKNKKILELLEELKVCEEYLLKHKGEIIFGQQVEDDVAPSGARDSEPEPDSLAPRSVDSLGSPASAYGGITLEMLSDSHVPAAVKGAESSLIKSKSREVSLVASIVSQSAPLAPDEVAKPPPIRRIEDISPAQFKRDLLQTTDWHLYYKKLSALGVFVRDKTHWPYFNQVFLISAKQNDGVDELKRYIFSRARPGKWVFGRSMVTDQMPQEIVEMCVREKMLENLPDELPYELDLITSELEVDENDCLNVIVEIIPSRKTFKRQLSILLQNKAHLVRLIREQAHEEMVETFQCDVRFKLVVRTSK